MQELCYTNGREEDNLILKLWHLFRPGEELDSEATHIAERLEVDFGYVRGDIQFIWGIEPDERFRKFYGDMNEKKPSLPPEAAARAFDVMRHILQNVNYPIEAYQKGIFGIERPKQGIRLAREITTKGYFEQKGLEIVVFDKGPGIRNNDDSCGVLRLFEGERIKKNPCHPQMPFSGDGLGLEWSIGDSDVYEIETLGKRWQKKAPKTLTDVPFVEGTKVRAEVYEYSWLKKLERKMKLKLGLELEGSPWLQYFR